MTVTVGRKSAIFLAVLTALALVLVGYTVGTNHHSGYSSKYKSSGGYSSPNPYHS